MSPSSSTSSPFSLRPALDADCRTLSSARAGRIAYYADESGAASGKRALLLVHSLNAAPSAREMKPLFERFRGERSVYALDLPGFGRSERGDRDYTPAMLADAVDAVANEIGSRSPERSPIDVVALSLGAEIAARAIALDPPRYASLALLSPTGFSGRNPPTGFLVDAFERVLANPWLGEPLFRALTSEASIRFFLARNFEGEPAPEMIDYAAETARQPGARFGPFRFLAGRLFTADALALLYEPLGTPTLVLFDRDPNVGFERLDAWVRARPNRSSVRIAPTRGLPHWEQLDRCVEALEAFWSATPRPARR